MSRFSCDEFRVLLNELCCWQIALLTEITHIAKNNCLSYFLKRHVRPTLTHDIRQFTHHEDAIRAEAVQIKVAYLFSKSKASAAAALNLFYFPFAICSIFPMWRRSAESEPVCAVSTNRSLRSTRACQKLSSSKWTQNKRKLESTCSRSFVTHLSARGSTDPDLNAGLSEVFWG